MKVVNSIADLIGDTPILKINRLTDPNEAEIFVKLETGWRMMPGSYTGSFLKAVKEAPNPHPLFVVNNLIFYTTLYEKSIGLNLNCLRPFYGQRCPVALRSALWNLQ